MLRTIFFDLDDTLLDFTASEAAALRQALTELGLPAGDGVLDRYHAINQRCWKQLEDGLLTREQVMRRRFALLFSELGVSASPQAVSDRYEALLARCHTVLPGALELLETLSPRYELYLASNGAAAVQHSRLRDSGILPYCRGVFISEEVGFHKPRPEFFHRCFAAIPGFDPAAALMVGDSLTSDIRGGRDAGLRTCWYHPGKERTSCRDIRPDYEIARLDQLPALLARL